MGCSICIWSHDIKVLFLSSDPVKDILDMLALDLRSKNKKEPATSEQQAWQPVPEMIGYSLSSFNDFPLDKFVKSLPVPGTG